MDDEKIKGIKESFLILKQLDHPNILKTYYLYIEQFQEKCYLVSEFCDYPDLRTYLQKSI
jgi:serine/threonine protein kinase